MKASLILHVLADPGMYVPRKFGDRDSADWTERGYVEPLHEWQARALVKVLADEQEQSIGVGVAVLKRGPTRILLGKRIGTGGGQYGTPGGRMDPSDTSPYGTARRELEEETGLVAALMHKVSFWSFSEEDNGDWVTLWYQCRARGIPELREPEKCVGWAYYPLDDLPSPLTTPTRDFIEHLERNGRL